MNNECIVTHTHTHTLCVVEVGVGGEGGDFNRNEPRGRGGGEVTVLKICLLLYGPPWVCLWATQGRNFGRLEGWKINF